MCRKFICLVSLTMFFVLSGVEAGVILHYDASKDIGDLDGDGIVEWEDVTEVSGTGANGDGTGLADWDWDTSLMGIGDSGVDTPPAVNSAYSGISNAFYFAEDNDARGHTIARQKTIPLSFAHLSPDPTGSSSTWEIWFKPDNLNGQKVLVESGAGTGSSFTLNGSTLQFTARESSSNSAAGISVDLNNFDTSEFLQAVGVIDMDNDFIALYVNGNLMAGGAGGDTDSQWTGNRWAGVNGATLGDGDGDDSGNMGVGGNGGTFGGLNSYAPYEGYVAIFRLYDYALTEQEIQEVMNDIAAQTIASSPNPANEATDVPRDVVLSWTPGKYAPPSSGHKVYISENFGDVNDGIGGVTQDANSYVPPQRLDLGKTYYWRVDEANSTTGWDQGELWQFTTEPIGYAIGNITATASSSDTGRGPENTVNGSGLDDSGLLHGRDAENTMWLSDAAGPQPSWIEFQFDKVYKLHQMWVWNSNGSLEPVIGLGFKDVSVEYSVNGTDYTPLGTTHEFARAPGAPGYAHNTTIVFNGVVAKYVRLTANSNWGGLLPQYGLSEVRFFYVPLRAREPSPDSGATNVDVDVTLSFRAGREAAQHDVYFGSDEQAVIDGNVPVTTLPETSYGPLSLDLAQTYYWKVNEVNMAESPTTLEGDVWNFATREFLVVDDFESYNDLDPDDPESNRIFNAWIDGLDQPLNGSVVGYAAAPFCEQTIVHSGGQSMPLFYDNTGTARYSEAELTLSSPQDWTKHAVNALSLWFSGEPNNVPDQMYVKINGSKVTYDGDARNLTLRPWQAWNIDLAPLSMDLQNVTTFSVGFGDVTSMMPGGSGVVYVDDISLYPYSRQLATPAEPPPANLVAHYEFEGTASDSSGNGLHGTAMGDPAFVAGKVGQAISFDGFNNFVEITGYKGILGPNAVTVTAWINTTTTGTGAIVGWGPNVDGQRFGFRVNEDRIRMENAGGNVQGESSVNDGGWHHVAVTVQESATISYPDVILYLDGIDDTRPSTDTEAFNLTADQDVRIGSRPASNDRFFMGLIDDVRIYDRALTQEEIAWLAGRTKPFDKPF